MISIVVPLFGFNQFILRILKGNPQKGTTMETFGRVSGIRMAAFGELATTSPASSRLEWWSGVPVYTVIRWTPLRLCAVADSKAGSVSDYFLHDGGGTRQQLSR